MKHLFFVAVATGIFSGTSITASAQTNVNLERFAEKPATVHGPRFIEGIEMVQPSSARKIVVETPNTTPAVSTPGQSAAIKTGFTSNIEVCPALQFKYAMMMDREVESIVNFSLYQFIDAWWATRYRYGGNDRSGIDCSAFTGKALEEVFGLDIPRTAREQYNSCEKVTTELLEEGDLVFFNTSGGVSHVGLYLGDNYFVHSSVHSGVTISSLADDYYSSRFISGGRIAR